MSLSERPPNDEATEQGAMSMMTRRLWVAGAAALMTGVTSTASAQQAAVPYVRWAELEVDPGKAAGFTAIARENAAATLQEPGVIAFHFAAEKGHPGRLRVLEVYSSRDAYRAHLQSTHFQRFAHASQSAVIVRRLHDVVPVLLGSKRTLNSAAPHVRVAELEIDATRLEAYKTAVTEEIEASIRLEPGVLAIYSLALKDGPTQLRFFEIYADEPSYRKHIESPHFKKYVDTTRSMITARKLIEMESPSIGIKAG
jgi:quinol monooxygenase YgiN